MYASRRPCPICRKAGQLSANLHIPSLLDICPVFWDSVLTGQMSKRPTLPGGTGQRSAK